MRRLISIVSALKINEVLSLDFLAYQPKYFIFIFLIMIQYLVVLREWLYTQTHPSYQPRRERVKDVTYLQLYITKGDKKKMTFVKASDHLLNSRCHTWLHRKPFNIKNRK